MVNGPEKVYIERKGKLTLSKVTFENNEHVLKVIDRIVSPLGRRIDESSPLVDARLPDGSRVNAIIPPLALNGPTLTIRKFEKDPLTIDDLVRFGSMSSETAEFLRACVIARLNIIVSGGTGSGKTTLLNVLSSFIPEDERIITVENAAELQLRQEHVVTLESRPPNIEGKGEVTIRDLVINTLRMRPDRVVVGECRGGETLDMLQAMNTGHDGSLTTAHANSPRDMLSRLETMCLMAGMDLPVRAIREQIASAVDMIVQQARMRDGSRKVTNCTEVQGMEGDVIVMSDIFVFEQQGIENGKIIGRLKATGIRPKFYDRIEAAGLSLPANIFGVTVRY
jgi:pilus assembly protein CpaF